MIHQLSKHSYGFTQLLSFMWSSERGSMCAMASPSLSVRGCHRVKRQAGTVVICSTQDWYIGSNLGNSASGYAQPFPSFTVSYLRHAHTVWGAEKMGERMRRQKVQRINSEYTHPCLSSRLSQPGTPVQARCRQAAWVCKSEHVRICASLFPWRPAQLIETDLISTETALTAFHTSALLFPCSVICLGFNLDTSKMPLRAKSIDNRHIFTVEQLK